ncbi:hypothetical protein AAHA92_33159 [Salvia divinorum]|uniref:FHA domain-containing protein n=1 Tax=Salvia divinorum TaxID=28513 RepID=A0ABD1FN30_SALDI
MSSTSDSSFSFQIRKRHQFDLQPLKKLRLNTVRLAILHIKTLNLPLISSSTTQYCESLFLEPCKPYTIGRKSKLCDFVFADARVSKRHCQLYFDSLEKKIYLSDGYVRGCSGSNASFSSCSANISTNGVFVNGSRISGVVELRVGDVVVLVCSNNEACGLSPSIGFLVEKAVFAEEVDYKNSTVRCCRGTDNTSVLLSRCRDILCSDDPVYYIRQFMDINWKNRIHLSFGNGLKASFRSSDDVESCSSSRLQIGCPKRKRVYSRDVDTAENRQSTPKEITVISAENVELGCSNFVSAVNTDTAWKKCNDIVDEQDASVSSNFTGMSLEKQDSRQSKELSDAADHGGCILPPGKKFYLNRLHFKGEDIEGNNADAVSLPELFHPIESLERVFIATFTSDISWFLTYCKIPLHLPVTIACHSAERCWSVDIDKRTSVPFTEYPNLTVVYPPFPEVIAFNNDRKKSGIACHHPKLIVLQREDKLRVVITSANLVAKQWHDVTNTVWWQDFPRLNTPNCLSLFTRLCEEETNIGSKCDFAAQLAGFMASLVADVPSQASWILELIQYDFSGAAGYLVASVPGIHSQRSPVYESKNLLVGNNHELWSSSAKFLSSVETSVVGLSHIYRASADSNGMHLKKLALFLGKFRANVDGMSEVVLRRITNIPADGNAVSVLISNPEDLSVGDFVQLGFLPRNVAKWVAPLSDTGHFAFSAFLHPKEVLETALEQSSKEVKLILYVYAGPTFSAISGVTQLEYASAICSLVASSQRYAGLWRLKEVLGLHKWPEHLQSEFIFGSSSVGSVNAQFLASFAAAAGKTSVPFSDSDESDPDWGCWTSSQELKNPSIRIIFPSIERVKTNRSGIMASRRLLCFSQKTWQRLENAGILHDAIPHPSDRVGYPMHVKVGRRRFLCKKDGSSFGWVYCGSHNFSAAAWGRPLSDGRSNGNMRNNSALGSRLHISNYELGIVFIVPPPDGAKENTENLDDVGLPFVVPPPKYRPTDKPATAQAIREALAELSEREKETNEATAMATDGDWMEEGVTEHADEEEEEEVAKTIQYVSREKEAEKAYADQLWSQVDS